MDRTAEVFAMDLQQFIAAMLMADEALADPRCLKVESRYRAEMLAHQFTAILRVPGEVLQDNRVVASWPDGLWQTVRAKLGLSHRRQELRVNEIVAFPQVKLPPLAGPRIYFHSNITMREVA